MGKLIKLHRENSVNLGDYYPIFLLQQLGVKFEEVNSDYKELNYQVCGSILNRANSNSIIWGSGIAWEGQEIPEVKQLAAVRGHLLAERLTNEGRPPEAVGDPLLLMPEYLPKPILKYSKPALGIIGHYTDYYHTMQNYRELDWCCVIDILKNPHDIIWGIHMCDICISSSLHGMIICHAFDIPCIWVEFSNKIGGDGWKYRDYLNNIDADPLDLTTEMPIKDIRQLAWDLWRNGKYKPEYDLEALKKARPF